MTCGSDDRARPVAEIDHRLMAELLRVLAGRKRHSWCFVFALIPLDLFGTPAIGGLLRDLSGWLGFLLVSICVLGRSYCSIYIAGRKTYELVANGPYAVVRHPLYAFSFVGVCGIGLQTGSLLNLAVLATFFIFYYRWVAAREEALLLCVFGDTYGEYIRRVPRWWPKLSAWQEPELIQARPAKLRAVLTDGAVFFLVWPGIELLDRLHAAGWLPTCYALP